MSTRGRTVRIGTRGSALALRQASAVKERLEQRNLTVELVEVETEGDQLRDELIHRLGKTGAFVRALDEKVLSGDLDAAVHSMKDVPTDQPSDLVVAGIPERAGAADVLVTPGGTELADLPREGTVGTSSLRRGAQLRNRRPDLRIEPLRGNVDTRVEKLLAPSLQREHTERIEAADGEVAEWEATDEATDGEDADGDAPDAYDRTVEEWFDDLDEVERQALGREVDVEYDAICLAEAGLSRSGLFAGLATERLDPTSFVPAPGQGTLAVTAVDGDLAELLHGLLDHPPTRVATTVERTVLAALGGGCVAPIGVYARLQGEVVTTNVRVLARAGDEGVTATRELPVERHAEAAETFAGDLADRGAADLVERAKRDRPDDAKRDG